MNGAHIKLNEITKRKASNVLYHTTDKLYQTELNLLINIYIVLQNVILMVHKENNLKRGWLK